MHAVLVVEDEPLIRLAAMSLVEDAGFEALEATNADEAIAILEAREDVRVVFTDIEMPGSMDGVKLARYIRERWPPVQLIVASGKAIVGASGLPAGARFFSKPYADHAIADTLRSMLAN
jgi:CheY-like chemotaxis protein